ncbi:MAG: hypothetical protein M0036_06230 [Desulfobacteraceae bacterium]|nr:hypothetical protein [Desulfobacteraceae bacterium]
MHYDEYEISMGREINFCRSVIKRLKSDLAKKEQRFAMTTQRFLAASGEELLPVEKKDRERWQNDYRQLNEWQSRLQAYEEALAMVKRQ